MKRFESGACICTTAGRNLCKVHHDVLVPAPARERAIALRAVRMPHPWADAPRAEQEAWADEVVHVVDRSHERAFYSSADVLREAARILQKEADDIDTVTNRVELGRAAELCRGLAGPAPTETKT